MFGTRVLLPAFVVAGLLTVVHGGSEIQVAGKATGSSQTEPAFGDDLLPFEDRVRYQHAIEEVYWRNRTWPTENPGSKPALDELLPEALLRERVTTYLLKSAALERYWSRPLTGEQLQAEVNRMVRDTRNAYLLRELFVALDDDPLLIAECLARPILADRLTRNWYARDTRFHGTLREQAEAALEAIASDPPRMKELRGIYGELELRLTEDRSPASDLDSELDGLRVVELSAKEWQGQTARLAGISPGGSARLTEENDRFVVTAVLSKTADRLQTATVTWSKRSFDAWWTAEGRAAVEASVAITPALPPTGGYELPSIRNRGCTSDTWSEMWYMPAARTRHTAVWTGTEMIVWGGSGYSSQLNTGGRYDPATDSWTKTSIGAGVPTARDNHTAVWTGTEMIVWGGTDGTHLNTGGRYDPGTDSWTATSSAAGVPTARESHTAVWTGTEMIVWGGSDGNHLNTGGRYEPAADNWTATSTALGVPTARVGHTAVWANTEMIVWGGVWTNTGGRYNPATDSWAPTPTGTGAPRTRAYHTAVWTGTEMIVWGGEDRGIHLRTGGRFDPATHGWTAISTDSGVPLEIGNHTAVWTGSEMIVWGGEEHSTFTWRGGRYDPTTDSWTATPIGGLTPPGRHGHTAVWTGSEMIVWGGADYNEYFDLGGRYAPATDSWTPTSTRAGVPAPRLRHAAVWTGSEMIVWGGKDHVYDRLNTGDRYDPSTDNWTPTSVGTGVPTGREYHTAVWTGTEMIVWGGWGSAPAGGRYSPVTDRWTATSTVDDPAHRRFHTAVWTGSEMIVWGGDASPSALDTGARYDPASDSWSATSMDSGVPSAREYHTAVWTGSEMIVWGGSDGNVVWDTGGRYNPAFDKWTAMTTETGTPSKRTHHVAVWTGTKMVVWGGYSAGGFLSTGGQYDPLTDSWTATSTGSGVPTIPVDTARIWSGRELIVWGGSATNTGARYDPAIDSWVPTSTGPGVPPPRADASTVWSGTEMIVWGGRQSFDPMNSGGLYCVCEGDTVSLWYPDSDGDGLGVDTTGVYSCVQPPNYVAVGGDCDDRYAACTSDCTDADLDDLPVCASDCDDSNAFCTTDCTDADSDTYCVTHDCDDMNPAVHTGAAEINDALDNNCPGDVGHGIVDEISGESGFHDPGNRDEFSWTAQGGATSYEVARSTDRQFLADCAVHSTTATHWDDGTSVQFDTCFHYLVRPTQPNLGSWGARSSGVERTPVCP